MAVHAAAGVTSMTTSKDYQKGAKKSSGRRDKPKLKDTTAPIPADRKLLIGILNSMKDGIYIVNQRYEIEYRNPALEAQFGVVKGRRCYEYLHDRKEVCPWCKNKEVFAGNIVHWEWYSEKTGKTYDLLDTPLKNADGSVSKLEVFRDITERKRMEEELKRNRDYLKSLNDSLSEAILTVDIPDNIDDRTVRYANKAIEEIFGYKQKEWLGKSPVLQYARKEDFIKAGKVLKSAISRGTKSMHRELLLKRRNGDTFPAELTTTFLRAGGKVTQIISIIRDITERKQVEQALRESEELHRVTLMNMSDAVFITDENGALTFICPNVDVIFGYSAQEVNEKGNISFLLGDGLFDVDELESVGEIPNIERLIMDKMGKQHTLLVTVKRIDIRGGTVLYTCRDITQRKRMEEAITREKNLLQIIMENTDAMLAYLDPDFNFVRVNSSYARGSGHTMEELIGKHYFDLFPHKENQAIFEKVRDTGEPVEYHDKPFEFKNQSWRGITYWDWTLAPVKDASGKAQGLVLSLIETTERKKLEQLKDEFIGLVSHELRTPLTVIMGCLNTVLSEKARLSSAEIELMLRDALSETESLGHLLGNLLELSRIQAGQLLLYMEPVRIDVVAREVIQRIKKQTSRHHFSMDLPETLPPVNADSLRLERILYNLLENAVKYSPRGGEIKVVARQDRDHLVISVADQGIGISPFGQAKLFELFQQLDQAGSLRNKGAGLGLLACRRLVEAHGGRIWVESRPDRGSTFFFTLPLRGESGV